VTGAMAGSVTGSAMAGSAMGWLGAWFVGLDSLLCQLRGPVLLVLLVASAGGLLAVVVALGRGAFATRGRAGRAATTGSPARGARLARGAWRASPAANGR
jgi:hypothetical protein